MTQSSDSPATAPQPCLSMFDVYSGYVLTQGHNALQSVVMWERIMRVLAWAAILLTAALWLAPGATLAAEVVPLKLVLSAVLLGMAAMLLWSARTRPQYEAQIDLIHGELRQVMRAASGLETLMLRVDFDRITGLYLRPNHAVPQASCLYLELQGIDEPLLLGVGETSALAIVHQRLTGDLAQARTMPRPPRAPHDDGKRNALGMQVA